MNPEPFARWSPRDLIPALPLNGRDWTQLATLSTGVFALRTQPDASGMGNRGNRGFGAQLSIAGGRPQQNAYRLDGIRVNDYANSSPGGTLGVTLGVDAIEEFSIETANYSAAYGVASGGVINAITRSGTNRWHASFFEFLRNDRLDARNFFDREKPRLRRNQFGAATGGPLKRDRTFLFAAYEGLRQSLGITDTAIVPSMAARTGQLTGRTVAVDPNVARYLGIWPTPNGASSGDSAIYNFERVCPDL